MAEYIAMQVFLLELWSRSGRIDQDRFQHQDLSNLAILDDSTHCLNVTKKIISKKDCTEYGEQTVVVMLRVLFFLSLSSSSFAGRIIGK